MANDKPTEPICEVRAAGQRAGHEFVDECLRRGVPEINPQTLTRERMNEIAAENGIGEADWLVFLRGFWEAMTGRAPRRLHPSRRSQRV